jgi:hypothetical protein
MENLERKLQSELTPESGLQSETEPIKVEKEIISPWERTRKEDDARFIERYQETSKFEKGTKKEIDRILTQETDQTRIEFTQKWFERNKDKIRDTGYDITSENEEYIVKVVSELGGFKDLKKEEWKEQREQIDNLYVLKTDFQKDVIPLDSQFLILNTLNKRTERIEEEIEKIKKQKKETKKDKIMIKTKKQELKELFKIRQELAGKSTGNRNLREIAEKEIGNRTVYEFINYKIREAKIEKIIEEKITEIGERSKDTIESMYNRVKERLITESVEKNLKKEKKTAEQLEAIKKELEKTGETTISDVISKVTKREGLENLTGNLGNDNEKVRSFLKGSGILPENYSDEDWRSAMERYKEEYNPGVVKSEIGFLEFIFNLIFNIIEIIKPEKKK